MKRVKNTLITNVLILLIAVVYFAILIFSNVGSIKAAVAVTPGSYGEQYANEKHLDIAQLSDSQKDYFDRRYEQFDYYIDARDRVVLENYSGISTDLVIPAYIGGKEVAALDEKFMASLSTVKNLYISNSVKGILGEADKTIVIHCYDDNEFHRANLESDWNFERILDSDFVDFSLGDMPFEYNNHENSIEITQYTGNEEYIIIPSYLNGYPVTTVSMNLLGTSKIVVIPATVTSITGKAAQLIYSSVFAVEMIFSVIAFGLALIAVNVLLPRYAKSNKEYMLTGNQMVLVVLYVALQTAFCVYAIYSGKISLLIAIVVSAVLVILFLCLLFLGEIGRQHATEVSQNMAAKTARMDALKASTKHLADDVKNPELKKQVQRLVDEIRYSDPVSTKETELIEKSLASETENLQAIIREENNTLISETVEVIFDLLNKRNDICKSMK